MKKINVTIPLPDDFIDQVADKVNRLNPKQHPENTKLYYTVKEVANLTEVCKRTIQNHIKAGLLKASKPGKSFLISDANLKKYMKTNE